MKKLLRALGLLLEIILCFSAASAADKPYVVLALSGGGVKGYAHVGVLQVLEKNGIGVAGIVGTSMGSIIGALYAAGYKADQLDEIIRNTSLGKLISGTQDSYFNLSGQVGQDATIFRPEIYTNAKGKTVGPLGLSSGTGVLEFMANRLSHVPVTDFNQLPIRFAAVATDLETGEKVVIRHGSLASAVRASMSIPGVFDPWPMNGRLLVDGGLVSNMPVRTAKEIFPGYPVIAINLTSKLSKKTDMSNMVDVVMQMITILTMQNVREEAKLADLVINPGVEEYPILGSVDGEEIIQQGRDIAQKMLPQIFAVCKKAPHKTFRQDESMTEATPNVTKIKVEGLPEQVNRRIEAELSQIWKNKPIDMTAVIAEARKLETREDVRAVDYDRISTADGVMIKYKIQRFPAHRYALEGYGGTLSGKAWLTVQNTSYDFLTPGDILQSRFYLADNWGAQFDYFWDTASDRGPWEMRLTASQFSMEPNNVPGQFVKWRRYTAAVEKHFLLYPKIMLSLGADYSYFNISNTGENSGYVSPMLSLGFNYLNPNDENSAGFSAALAAYMPSPSTELMLRAEAFARFPLGSDFSFQIRGGYMNGDSKESPVLSAYLGARNELYSLSAHPLMSEEFAWWRLSLVHPLTETLLGNLSIELFGGQGYAWDDAGNEIDNPWEVGIALTAPRKLLNARLFAVYGSTEDWRFGISIGTPDWRTYLPY